MKIRFKIKQSAIFKDWNTLNISDDTENHKIKDAINAYCNNFLGVFNVRKNSDIVWEEVKENIKKVA